jgi:outer membrane autotransporter protein
MKNTMRRTNGLQAAFLAMALTVVPALAAAQSSVTIPLSQNPDGSGFSNFITVSVGGGPSSQVLLDTGSTGLRFLASQLGPNVTVDYGVPVTYGYSSGNLAVGYLGQASISFPDASSLIATPSTTYFQVVTNLTCKSDYSSCPGWATGQSGVMGVAYDNDQIFNPLAQLPGVLGNGFIVVSNDLSNSNLSPEVVVGLTPANMQGFVFTKMANTPGGLQPAGLNVWNTKSIYTCFAVNSGAPGCYDAVFDTGASAGSFETGDTAQYGQVAYGSTVTINVPDVLSLSLPADGNPNANLFYYDTAHGGTPGYNSGAELFRYYAVLFDAQTGQIGFSPIVNWIFGTYKPADDSVLGAPGAAIALGGKLELRDGFSSSRPIYLISDAELKSDGYATLSGTITGSDRLKIRGPGTLDFTGSSLYSGLAEVKDGATVLVNGVLPASFALDSGTTLGGNGIIGNLAAATGSTIAPGNSVGTLQVAGDLVLAPGANYEVQLGAPGTSDLISAGGQALLAGTVTATPVTGFVPLGGASYTILTANGGVSGSFDPAVDTNNMFGTTSAAYPFLLPALGYTATAVTLTLGRSSVPFTSAAATPNELATATAADATGLGNGLVDALAGLNTATLPAALNAASGQIYASVQSLLQQRAADMRGATTARLRQALTGGDDADPAKLTTASLLPAAPERATLWTEAFGGGDHFAGNSNAAALYASGGGFVMGLDSPIGQAWRAGIAGGYTSEGFNAASANGSIASYDAALYAGAHYGVFRLRLGTAYSWNNVSAGRNVSFPGYYDHVTGSYRANTAQAYGEIDAALPLQLVSVEPFADLADVNTNAGSFTETGGAAALSAAATHFNTVFSTLGTQISKGFSAGRGTMLDLTGRLGWQHGFGDITPVSQFAFSGGTAPFAISGVPLSRNAAILDAGIAYHPSPAVSLSLYYTGQLAPATQENNIDGAIAITF